MNFGPNVRRTLQIVGAVIFIALGALSASRARSDPLTEAYVLGLIAIGAIAFAAFAAHSESAAGAAPAEDFERRADAALAHALKLIRDHAADGARFGESLAGANRKLSRGGSYDAVHEIVLTLINDNRAMQNKVNGLSEKLEQSRFQIMRLRSNLNKAEEIGVRDALTGIGNRRYFDNALAEQIVRARENEGELCVGVADIDAFKAIVDKFGRMAGDMVLKRFADLLTANAKGDDKVARLEGEQFAILLPEARLNEATVIVAQIQKQLEGKRWALATSGQPLGAVSASFALASLRKGESAEELLRRVDEKLVEAKSEGRNRIAVDAEDRSPAKAQT
ncbi:MAG: GGDEF domain-containing protein [Bradyrhizobium sp.]|nr:MAG: GGDEF domain-containing protein [Bradyrhizobium sp.]